MLSPNVPLRLLGDSQLIIRFMLGIFKKIRKASIYTPVTHAKELLRRVDVAFRHVPRHLNTVADDMCRRAEAA